MATETTKIISVIGHQRPLYREWVAAEGAPFAETEWCAVANAIRRAYQQHANPTWLLSRDAAKADDLLTYVVTGDGPGRIVWAIYKGVTYSGETEATHAVNHFMVEGGD